MINIKEMILMYAPTILMAVSVILNYLKTFKALKTNVKNMENSKSVKTLNKGIGDLQFEIVSRSKYLIDLKNSNEKLMLKLEELNKKIDEIEIDINKAEIKKEEIEVINMEQENEEGIEENKEVKEA